MTTPISILNHTTALDEAISMLETIAKGKSYDSMEYLQRLAAMKEARTKTVTVDASLWKSLTFFVEGLAIMETTKLSHPALHSEVVKLARSIETFGGAQ